MHFRPTEVVAKLAPVRVLVRTAFTVLVWTAFTACSARSPTASSPATSSPTASPTAPSAGTRGASLRITSAADLVAPGIVSSKYVEIRVAASPDGTMLLWGSTDRPGGAGGWDIWVSRRTGATWGPPAAASFNSEANDFDPAFSADGRWVYFFSNRPGGFGGDDIYRAAVTAEGFGPAQHLGPEVNTAGDEWAPAPSPDGMQLLFASNKPGGKHDLFIAPVRGDGFGPASPLPGAINTPDADEFDATFLPDGSSLIFSRSRDVDNDPIELDFARRGPSGYDAGTPLPASVNVAGGYTLGPSIDLHEPGVLYFSGKRPEAAAGKLDIYRVRYALDPAR